MNELKKLKIVILSGVNPYTDSGVVAHDMFNCLKNYGHSVKIITKYFDNRFQDGISSVYSKWESIFLIYRDKLTYKLTRKTKRFNYYMHSIDEYKRTSITKRINLKTDGNVNVFIYLFPHGFLNFQDLEKLSVLNDAMAFLMPVDMALFTGGCHYSNECQKYINTCGKCPGLNSENENDATQKNILFKKKHLLVDRYITLSNTWLSERLKRSFLFNDIRDFYLNIVVNDTIFKPSDLVLLREKHNISSTKKVIFFAATYMDQERKGLKQLIEALKLLYNEYSEDERFNTILLTAGNLSTDIRRLIDFDIINLGHLTHEQLANAFQVSDVFVSPSLQDAGPMMVIQSMMCGTPVVAFEMGNASDFIEDGITGYKVPLINIELLKEKIKIVLQQEDTEKKRMRQSCRKKALAESSYESFSKKFTNIYFQLLIDK